jgi:crotonobetainyl-CoA:carnitine CoA-transferase CaiB-like acyl-CoA transferase
MTQSPSNDALRTRGGPLQGVRLVELTKVWAGPHTGKLLAFLGAEVIRVESRSALDSSRWYNGDDIDGAAGYQAANPQKLSVQIDTRKPEGKALLLKLVATADIFIENLRPGAIARAGLDYESIRKVKPDIVYLSMGMYGNDGPLAYQSGYAPCFAALGGLSAIVGYEGEVPQGMNIRYGDSTAGAAAAFAATTALLHRRRTGEGQFIDVSAVEVLSSMIGDTVMDYAVNGTAARCDGNRHAEMAPHGAFPCRDGQWISLAVSSDEQWHLLAGAVGDEAIANSDRFATLGDRQQNLKELDALLSRWTQAQDAATLESYLQALGIAAARSLNTVDLVADRDLWGSGYFHTVTDFHGEERSIMGPSWYMSEPATLNRGAPALGQDNDYVLGDLLGLPDEERRRLVETGVTV